MHHGNVTPCAGGCGHYTIWGGGMQSITQNVSMESFIAIHLVFESCPVYWTDVLLK
jgi:hypothetical protein